jgi:hypothetical protein
VNASPLSPRRLWWLAAGFGLWVSALLVLYALQSLGCAFAWAAGALQLGLFAVLLAHLGAIAWIWREFAVAPDTTAGDTGRFLHSVVVGTVVAAFAATLLVLGPPLLLTACT